MKTIELELEKIRDRARGATASEDLIGMSGALYVFEEGAIRGFANRAARTN